MSDDPRLAIELSQGRVAVIDQADAALISGYSWYFDDGYAVANFVKPNGRRSVVGMHRVINGTPAGFDTDHRNHDTLDNRRANLRTATRKQNQQNRAAMRMNTSGVRGVSFDNDRGRWAAYIKVDYRKIALGRFATLDEAAEARRRAEELYFV